jgi:hypothetical protein
LAKFQDQLTDLCGRYRRWMQLVMKRGIAPRASERFVGLTLTMPGGEESSVFVARNDESDSIAKDVLELIERSATDDTDLPPNCAFPYAGLGELTKPEEQAIVIIRPGKPNLYQSVAGGQNALPEQTASVVFKLVKVKEPQTVAQQKTKKSPKVASDKNTTITEEQRVVKTEQEK